MLAFTLATSKTICPELLKAENQIANIFSIKHDAVSPKSLDTFIKVGFYTSSNVMLLYSNL